MTVTTFLESCGLSSDDYISHHGIKGQRWGVRRFQNKDGSLTDAGRRRLNKLEQRKAAIEAETDRLVPKKKTPNPHGKKSIFDMSDDELNKEITRLGLEKRYKDYMKELYPKQQKRPLIDGRKVVGDILQSSVKNVGKSVGETLLGKGVNRLGKQLGLEYDLYTKSSSNKKKKKGGSSDDDD